MCIWVNSNRRASTIHARVAMQSGRSACIDMHTCELRPLEVVGKEAEQNVQECRGYIDEKSRRGGQTHMKTVSNFNREVSDHHGKSKLFMMAKNIVLNITRSNLCFLHIPRRFYPVRQIATRSTHFLRTWQSSICFWACITGLLLIINLTLTIWASVSFPSHDGSLTLIEGTWEELDKAHAKGSWLDVEIPSVRNLTKINRKRAVTWFFLASSSVPLTLM